MVCMDSGERRYKKGEIIYRAGTFDTHIYNVLFGSVGIYMHYEYQIQCLYKDVSL